MPNFVERYLSTIPLFLFFKNFGFLNFNELSLFLLTWYLLGVKISKTLLLYSYNFFPAKLFLHIPCWQSSQNFLIGILKFQIWNVLRKIENFLIMGPYGSENFKMLLLQFRPNFFWMFPVTIHTKFASWNFEILNLNFLQKKDWNLTLCPMWNAKLAKISWKWLAVELNSEIWDSGGWGGGHRKYMYNFWNFYQWPSFMPRYGNFETLSHISQTAARRAKISSISTPWGRERVYVQLFELWPSFMPKLSMTILKISPYLGNRCL